jgi:hypothetical protein
LREEEAMEENGEVCLQEEVGRLWDRGVSEDEIARRMGVDPGWVSSVVAMISPADAEDGSGRG